MDEPTWERGVDPYMLVMLGDITDVNGFVERQTKRLGVRVQRKDVQHLVHRRDANGCPDPIVILRSAHVYNFTELQAWFDAYVLTHPRFMGGQLLEAVRRAQLREHEEEHR